MTHAIPQHDHHRLSRIWSSLAPAFLDEDGETEVDAIWVPPTFRNAAAPAAFLHSQVLDADRLSLTTLALHRGETTPITTSLPLEEVVFLTHGSLPPLSAASVMSADPLLRTPGDSEALRIRCLARVPPAALRPPSAIAAAIPGLRLQVVREATPGWTTSGFGWTQQGIVLEVERHPNTGEPTESSIGLALAAWFCDRSPFGEFIVQWLNPHYGYDFETAYREQVLATYKALRLPAVVLHVLLRALAGTDLKPATFLAGKNIFMPPALLRERIQALREGPLL